MTKRIAVLVAISILVIGGSAFLGPSLSGARGDFIFWQLRLPRVLLGCLVGATLSLVGAVFQTLFNNPLATPSTVGTTAGAALGALSVLVFNISVEIEGLPFITLAAFAGALATSWVVAAVAGSGRVRVQDVLLAGIAVTLAATAIATGIQYLADMRALFAASQWSLGQLPQVGYRGVLVILPFVAVNAVVLLALQRPLQTMVMGEELATAQGVDVPRLRLIALGVGSLGVAACVAWCGPIAFVDLIVPHIVRLLLGSGMRRLLPMSFILGGAFLVACDTLSRLLLGGRELPVGVLTAALGAPALIILIARARR
jgi:iron complex transport system permease protein